MFKTLAEAFKNKDIRRKILITIGLILLFRLGCWIPVPGLSTSYFASQVGDSNATFLQLLSGISGGALANGAILALGVSPYISASIIVQLLSLAIPALERLSKQGEEGKKKLATVTKWTTLGLGLAQAIGIVAGFGSAGLTNVFGSAPLWLTGACVVIILTAGAMFTYWLGEKITEYGISNGVSLLIFVGILSTAGTSLLASFTQVFTSNIDELWNIIIFLAVLILIFALIVMMDGAERKVKVQYAKQIKGRKMYGGQSTYIPIRLMGTGVMPIIFAMSFLSFPQIIMSIFWPNSDAFVWYSTYLGAGSWAYSVVSGLLILFFAYFYAQLSFNPEDVSKQIQSNGGFIPGTRPGKPTADLLKKISNRITLFGAIFLAFIAIVPTIVFKAIGSGGLVNAFSATGMIIVVGVALEVDKQIQTLLMMKNYRGFLK
ncbi:MAG: preprotein translocase subunit SecY [Clostridiales bacterium]|nr:preprotein translocase subunit SecY [Candidatus Apopatousia equi]